MIISCKDTKEDTMTMSLGLIPRITLKMSNTVVRIPDGVEGPNVSYFYNYKNKNPKEIVDLWDFVLTEEYKDYVEEYRYSDDKERRYEIKSELLPSVTVAGIFDTRAKTRLIHLHSGCICIDIDGKQNKAVKGRWDMVKKKLGSLFHSLCYAGLSISGDGLCLIFRIAYPERHSHHFYALVAEIKQRTGLIVDESGSDVVRLRGASYDPKPYFNPYASPYLHVKQNKYGTTRRKIEIARTKTTQNNTNERVYKLVDKIRENKIDITVGRDNWIAIGRALANEYGEIEGERLFHLVSLWHPQYDKEECDRVFAWCLGNCDNTRINTFFHHCKRYKIFFKSSMK